jgi:ribonuclease E
MSEPVLGAAGSASSEPAEFGRGGEEKPALDDRPRDWRPVGPEVSPDAANGSDITRAPDGSITQDGQVAQDGAVTKVSRRRRRGSRGGRGRHGMAVVSAPEDEAPEEPADATKVLTEGPPAPPPPKPKIGDTRPGSPPITKRRVRRDLAAGTTEIPLAGRALAGRRAEDAGDGPTGPTGTGQTASGQTASGQTASGTAGTGVTGTGVTGSGPSDAAEPRERRPRRRRGEPGEGSEAEGGAVAGASGAGGGAFVATADDRGTETRDTAGGRGASGDGGQLGGRSSGDRTTSDRTTSDRAAGDRAAGDRAAGDRVPGSGPRRGGPDRRGRPLGRYLMVVHVGPTATQIAVLEGRTLIEHYVSRPADDSTQIDGNIYLGRVQNVLPGMEAAFVDIGTPKNAVLYRGDLRFDDDDVERPASDDGAKPTRGRLGGAASDARIEQLLRTGQSIICQVTKNPIGTKGARLTQEVSLPGRFVVLIPDSETYGISKRLGDEERRRLRKILDDIRPAGHGLIVRTAAEGASAEELGRDVGRLLRQWEQVQQQARASRAPQLLYREPDLAVRVIREEFNRDYRGVVIDDRKLYDEVKDYVTSITPELADRVELVDPSEEPLPLFERFRVHEQVHKALDRKVWLPSGGSIIIERTEALTVIDVNTGKNVGSSNLEETVFRNNLEAAEEIARQLRLRDIGGIIVIDFIDMEILGNRAEVIRTFREALARDKTRSQVFDISELGLVEMTRKRISEGLVESYSETCPTCGGRGIVFDESLL